MSIVRRLIDIIRMFSNALIADELFRAVILDSIIVIVGLLVFIARQYLKYSHPYIVQSIMLRDGWRGYVPIPTSLAPSMADIIYLLFFFGSVAKLVYTFSRFRSTKKRAGDYLTDLYSYSLSTNAMLTAAPLISLGAIHWYLTRSEEAFIILSFWSLISILFANITSFRSRMGYFGTNASEAMELIAFIHRQVKNGSPPSSNRVSSRASTEHAALRPDHGSIEGARP